MRPPSEVFVRTQPRLNSYSVDVVIMCREVTPRRQLRHICKQIVFVTFQVVQASAKNCIARNVMTIAQEILLSQKILLLHTTLMH